MQAVIDEPEIDTKEVESLPALFKVTDAHFAELREARDELAPIEDEATYKAKKEVQKRFIKTEQHIEKVRVALVAPHLEAQRAINAYAKERAGKCKAIREPLDAEIADADNLRREAMLAEERKAEEARQAAIKAEADKMAAERAALDAEKAQLAAQRAEMDRLAKEESDRIAAAQKVEADRLIEEARKLSDVKRALDEAKAKADRAEFEQAARVKAEAEAKERLERQHAEDAARLVAAAEAAIEQQKAIDAARPDVEKLRTFALSIRNLPYPTVANKQASEAIIKARHGLSIVAAQLETFKIA